MGRTSTVGRFADDVLALAEVVGRDWIVKDRMWSGWPDPPEYAFFVLEGVNVWAVADFDRWPKTWSLPPVTPPEVRRSPTGKQA